MPSIIARSQDIRGLIPAIDSKKKDGYNIIAGRNFSFDVDGPKSSFGNVFLDDVPQDGILFAQGMLPNTPQGPVNFWALDQRIVQWVEALGTFQTILRVPSVVNSPARWTFASVNRVTFFCHPAVGILFFSVETGNTGLVSTDGVFLVGESVVGITQDNGRLIVLTNKRFINSAQDNGFDFDFSVFGGATAIDVNARVAGKPIAVTSFKEGCLTFTDAGIMKSSFIGGNEVYRHRAMIGDHVPINSLSILVTQNDNTIFLDERGVYTTRGDVPKEVSPIFNQFLITELERGTFLFNNNTRIEYDRKNSMLFLMLAETDSSAIYNRSYTLNTKLDKWGSFDESVYAIGPVRIDSGERRGTYMGIISLDQRFRLWQLAGNRKLVTTNPASYYYNALQQTPKLLDKDATTIVVSSTQRLSSLAEDAFAGISGHYTFDASAVIAPAQQSLDAQIQIGLLRFEIGEYPDEMGEIQLIHISSSVEGSVDADSEDYNTVPDGTADEDWNIIIGMEDWGFAPRTVVNFQFQMIATIDGQTTFNKTVPSLVEAFPAVRMYSTMIKGIWHIPVLEATEVGDFFHLRQIELNGIPAGRFK